MVSTIRGGNRAVPITILAVSTALAGITTAAAANPTAPSPRTRTQPLKTLAITEPDMRYAPQDAQDPTPIREEVLGSILAALRNKCFFVIREAAGVSGIVMKKKTGESQTAVGKEAVEELEAADPESEETPSADEAAPPSLPSARLHLSALMVKIENKGVGAGPLKIISTQVQVQVQLTDTRTKQTWTEEGKASRGGLKVTGLIPVGNQIAALVKKAKKYGIGPGGARIPENGTGNDEGENSSVKPKSVKSKQGASKVGTEGEEDTGEEDDPSGEADENAGGKTIQIERYLGTPVGAILRQAIENALGSMSARIQAIPWQAEVADVSDGTLILNAGSRAGLQPGDRLGVKRFVRMVTDPSTGRPLRTIWERIGIVEITAVEEETCDAKSIAGAGFERNDIVCELGELPEPKE